MQTKKRSTPDLVFIPQEKTEKNCSLISFWNLLGIARWYACLFLLGIVGYAMSPMLQDFLAAYFSQGLAIENLRGLILGAGTALIGASVIISSFVLYAIQVNIERMPHKMFRQFSQDIWLLGILTLAICTAIALSSLSAFLDEDNMALLLVAAVWLVFSLFMLYWHAYRRALVLVSPREQLGILAQDNSKELRRWDKQSNRAELRIRYKHSGDGAEHGDHDLDQKRVDFFSANSHWTDGTRLRINHAMSYARRYAEQGDYEVSQAALETAVALNHAYIKMRGRTFYGNYPFVINARAVDCVINDTLEFMRQNIQAGIIRFDEQQIEQTLRSLLSLVKEYVNIDYSLCLISKKDARIAYAYLSRAVNDLMPHGMANVLCLGQQLMGQSARFFIEHSDFEHIDEISDSISTISIRGCEEMKYYSVTREGIEQLSDLMYTLICMETDEHYHGVCLSIERISRDIARVTKKFLTVSDDSNHEDFRPFYGSYYSPTPIGSFVSQLNGLSFKISMTPQGDSSAIQIIRNIEIWARHLDHMSDLLPDAVKVQSNFTSDLFLWIIKVSLELSGISNSKHCSREVKGNLRKHACRLISAFGSIPMKGESVKFSERFHLTENLFEAARRLNKISCRDVSAKIEIFLVSWSLEGGKQPSTNGLLAKVLCALAVLAVDGGADHISNFKSTIIPKLTGERAPSSDLCGMAVREIRELALKPHHQTDWSPVIGNAIANLSNQEDFLNLMDEILAALLPPASSG